MYEMYKSEESSTHLYSSNYLFVLHNGVLGGFLREERHEAVFLFGGTTWSFHFIHLKTRVPYKSG